MAVRLDGLIRADLGEFVSGCGGLQPSELFSPTFQLPDGSRSRLAERTLP